MSGNGTTIHGAPSRHAQGNKTRRGGDQGTYTFPALPLQNFPVVSNAPKDDIFTKDMNYHMDWFINELVYHVKGTDTSSNSQIENPEGGLTAGYRYAVTQFGGAHKKTKFTCLGACIEASNRLEKFKPVSVQTGRTSVFSTCRTRIKTDQLIFVRLRKDNERPVTLHNGISREYPIMEAYDSNFQLISEAMKDIQKRINETNQKFLPFDGQKVVKLTNVLARMFPNHYKSSVANLPNLSTLSTTAAAEEIRTALNRDWFMVACTGGNMKNKAGYLAVLELMCNHKASDGRVNALDICSILSDLSATYVRIHGELAADCCFDDLVYVGRANADGEYGQLFYLDVMAKVDY